MPRRYGRARRALTGPPREVQRRSPSPAPEVRSALAPLGAARQNASRQATVAGSISAAALYLAASVPLWGRMSTLPAEPAPVLGAKPALGH